MHFVDHLSKKRLTYYNGVLVENDKDEFTVCEICAFCGSGDWEVYEMYLHEPGVS